MSQCTSRAANGPILPPIVIDPVFGFCDRMRSDVQLNLRFLNL